MVCHDWVLLHKYLNEEQNAKSCEYKMCGYWLKIKFLVGVGQG